MFLGRVIPGIIFIIFSIIILIETKNFPEKLGRDVGAAFWPKILIGLLVIFSVWLIITGILNKRKGLGNDKVKFQLSYTKFKPYLGMIVSILFVFLFKPLGFVVTAFLFYITLSHIMYGKFEKKFFIITFVQATSLILIIYLVFEKFLSVTLPDGILGF